MTPALHLLHRTLAAAEPGSEMPGVERGFRGAALLVQRKLADSGLHQDDRLRGVTVGRHKVDIQVTDLLVQVFDRRNLIPVVFEVVYSGITSSDEYNKLRRLATYNTRTGAVRMGDVLVPGSADPQKMLRNILGAYVQHVNLFARAAAEPRLTQANITTDSFGDVVDRAPAVRFPEGRAALLCYERDVEPGLAECEVNVLRNGGGHGDWVIGAGFINVQLDERHQRIHVSTNGIPKEHCPKHVYPWPRNLTPETLHRVILRDFHGFMHEVVKRSV